MTLANIFHSGGLWIIPFGLFAAAFYTLYRAYLASKSGSTEKNGTVEKGNMPIYKVNQFKYFVILFVFAVVTLIMIGGDYKGV